MSGKLFSELCTSISLENAEKVVDEIITKIYAKFPQNTCLPIGSAGHKKESSDIDIAVLCTCIDELKYIIKESLDLNEDPYLSKTFYIVSIPYKYDDNGEKKYIAIDFMQMRDVQYTYFRYRSPDYINNESKYKIGTRIMLVNDLLNFTIENQKTIDNPLIGYDFSPIGLYMYDLDENKEYYIKKFITYDVQEIMQMLFYEPNKDDFVSVEKLWKAIHTDNFKLKHKLKEIEITFFANCYRKCWEELIQPEELELSCVTPQEIRMIWKTLEKTRDINKLLSAVQEKRKKSISKKIIDELESQK